MSAEFVDSDGFEGRKPLQSGMYVVYTNDAHMPRYAARILLIYDAEAKVWGYPMSSMNYRGHVYGWVGPLPALPLCE